MYVPPTDSAIGTEITFTAGGNAVVSDSYVYSVVKLSDSKWKGRQVYPAGSRAEWSYSPEAVRHYFASGLWTVKTVTAPKKAGLSLDSGEFIPAEQLASMTIKLPEAGLAAYRHADRMMALLQAGVGISRVADTMVFDRGPCRLEVVLEGNLERALTRAENIFD